MSDFKMSQSGPGSDVADYQDDPEALDRLNKSYDDDLAKKREERDYRDNNPVIPLDTKVPEPVQPFTHDLLPGLLTTFVAQTAYGQNDAAPDFCAVGTVISLSSLIGGSCKIRGKVNDTWSEVPTLWGMAIGDPSSMKSPALKDVMSAIINPVQDQMIEGYKDALKEYESEMSIYKVEEKCIEDLLKKALANERSGEPKKCIASSDSLKNELTEHRSDQPVHPPELLAKVTDATQPKLLQILADNPRGTLLYVDEISGLLAELTDGNPRGASYRAFMLSTFSGLNINADQRRIGRDDVVAKNTILSLLGGVQPEMLETFISTSRASQNDGFIERCQLMVFPDSTPKLTDCKTDTVVIADMTKLAFRLSNMQPQMDGDPVCYKFCPDAQEKFNQFSQSNIEHGNGTPRLKGILNKYPAMVMKLALVFHLCGDGDGSEDVTVEALDRALKWPPYLLSHNNRINKFDDNCLVPAKRLLKKWSDLDDRFTVSDFSNKGWSGLTLADQRNEALKVLVKHRYLRVEESPAGNCKMLKTYVKNWNG